MAMTSPKLDPELISRCKDFLTIVLRPHYVYRRCRTLPSTYTQLTIDQTLSKRRKNLVKQKSLAIGHRLWPSLSTPSKHGE